MAPNPNRRTTGRPGDYEGQLHSHQLFPDIVPRHEPRRPPTLPTFSTYNQFNLDNKREDDDTFDLGFEVTRDRIHLSEKSRFYQPTPRSPPPSPFLREITEDEFRTAVEGPRAARSGGNLRHGVSDVLPYTKVFLEAMQKAGEASGGMKLLSNK